MKTWKCFFSLLSTLLLGFSVSLFAAQKNIETSQQCHYVKRFDKKTDCMKRIKVCGKKQPMSHLDKFLSSLTPSEHSALAQRLAREKHIAKSPYGISFYEPTYILPAYYTFRPYETPYQGNTPDNQSIMPEEFKAQLSLQFPIWANMFHSHFSLGAYYTQLSYWQIYANSQFFRETNYEPSLYLQDHFLPNWLAMVGIVHQSNGRGGELERSWNRVYFDLAFSGRNWMIDVRPWMLVFKKDSSDLHNPDIARFLGHERIVIAYRFHHQELSMMARNTFESGFKRGAIELAYEFPLYKRLNGYVQFFSGYGQSLIEYDHYTNALGIGIALSNWI